MVSNSVQLHNLIASLTNASKKGDMKAVAKWAREIAALAEPAPVAVPAPAATPAAADVPPPASSSGLTNWGAAQADAGFVLRASLGDLVGADTNPAPGAAKALGFSGVVGEGELYGTFVNGVLTTTGPNPGAGPDGFMTPFSLAAGIDRAAPYTGPGAVRP
jgi:hypothetical protein